jgi:hypothetical protein
MGRDCPEDSKNTTKDSKNMNSKLNNHKKWFNGKCYICGKEGHMAKDKRQKGWKS